MQKVKGGIIKPKGYFASATHCGIKKRKKDLCLIYSQVPAKAAGVFTSNKVQGAPLIVSKKNLKNSTAQAIIVNSGNANCLTGKQGLNDANVITKFLAKALSIRKDNVLIASTGIIGKRLPVLKITSMIDKLTSSLSASNSIDAARAIMTTDTAPKKVAFSIKVGSKVVNIGAIAKGAGMISPDMATMLAFITTDAAISIAALKKALRESVEASFNCITVDGDMSPNDCVLILANGLAHNKTIMPHGKRYEIFRKTLTAACSDMAEKIVRDAEGATKFVKVKVKGAESASDAKKAAYAIATSQLVKTAVYGEDPNWGRIAAALGRSGADFNADRLDIYLGGIKVLSKGKATKVKKSLLRKIAKNKDVEIGAVLNKGKSEATLLTSDLSKQYVQLNAHYTS